MTTHLRKPSRIRFSGFVFLFVYPLVTAFSYGLVPLTQGWPIWLRTLVMVPFIVGAMVYLIIPLIQRRLTNWL
jgi:antibiotic biosynthesis monooxygenase (ABM) superfamily enzyme